MFKKSLIVAASLALASSAFAQTGTKSPGTSNSSPGHQMQDGAKSSKSGPGASEYAPGHQTTTGSSTTTKKK